MMPGKARRGGMVRTSVAGAHQKLSSLARVHKRKNKAAFDADSRNVPVKYSDTVSEDKRRVNLLYLTRRSDPLGIVWDLRHIGFTALPRVLRSVNTVAVVSVYLTTAVTTRLGYWSYDSSVNTADDDLTALAGMELLVTFNLVFYFGYCYNRFWQMHELAVACKNALSGVCSLARGSQMTVSECQDIWRWLNLAHITGYVGLTHVYTRVNLLEGVAQTYGLFGRQSIEFKRLKELGLDGGTGNAAYGEFLVWVLRCISSASSRGVLDAATTENMQSLVLQMRAGMTGLYDYQFQVIPFCYIHLVALLTNLYLILIAIAKGRLFAPDASLERGLIFPLLALSFLSLSCLSLVEIGGRMQNPLGADDEDLPVHHLVDTTCKTSAAIIGAKPPGTFDDDEPRKTSSAASAAAAKREGNGGAPEQNPTKAAARCGGAPRQAPMRLRETSFSEEADDDENDDDGADDGASPSRPVAIEARVLPKPGMVDGRHDSMEA